MQNIKQSTHDPLIFNDQKHCWHPFTQAAFGIANLCIQRADGIYLIDVDDQKYIDAISSWWVVTQGHNHPKIAQAIANQTQKLSHTLFSGVTHPPAIDFASLLVQTTQQKGFDFQWVFYSDNGSTAIEAALKMAVQYHDNLKSKTHLPQKISVHKNNDHNEISVNNLDDYQHHTKRLKFMAFEGAYHGDTFGAMAVGKTSGFYRAFEDWLFDVDFVEYPELAENDNLFAENLTADEAHILEKTAAYLEKNHHNIAAFILEPIIQGASGMRFAKVLFLKKLLALFKQYNILIIADEVMTGFGRTGHLFACEYFLDQQFGHQIDIMCLSKGITGGFLAMGATLVRDSIYQAFLSDDVYHAFLHGHSYTANPLACSAALANLELWLENENIVHDLQKMHQKHLNQLIEKLNIELANQPKNIFKKQRVLGGIAAFNGLNDYFQLISQKKSNYGSKAAQLLRLTCLEQGVLLRPLGDCIYIMPPYCIQENELKKIYQTIADVLLSSEFQEKLRHIDHVNHQKIQEEPQMLKKSDVSFDLALDSGSDLF
jgi:adenosylmethionine---8-amino-7-oxononanoate aminotransferase